MKVPNDSNTSFVSENGYVSFEFNKVFDGNTDQGMIFDAVAKSKVHDLLEGINSTIFAYGQTGTGIILQLMTHDTVLIKLFTTEIYYL
jgi:hypothetical protein